MPQLISGKIQEVSRGVFCTERRDPLGALCCVCLCVFRFVLFLTPLRCSRVFCIELEHVITWTINGLLNRQLLSSNQAQRHIV
jgi:hypothetical protein